MTRYAAVTGLLKRAVRGPGFIMDFGRNGDLSSVYNKALRLFGVESDESLCQ